MKGKLEELNEPVDDLMEVSKVQTQILNLTKNQVNIYDEGTENFRSTYDILRDISEIWDTLSSTSRASLTEILFGKNRANTGLAIIQAFQSGQIESAYKDALNASGTATKEYQEMMKGVEASFAKLKGQFQEFANTVMSSDLVKTVVAGATKILKLLTFIIDKFGAIPTIIATIAAISTAKTGTNIFMSMVTSLKAMNVQLVLAKAGVVALNAALTGVLALGISYVVSKISQYVNKSKEAAKVAQEERERAEQRRQQTVDNIDAYDKEMKSLNDLVNQYATLVSSTTDINSKKEELLDLQNQITDACGAEARGIDLVNKSLEENIKLLTDQIDKKRKAFISENYQAIKDAQEGLGISEVGGTSSIPSRAYRFNLLSGKEEAITEAHVYVETIREYLKEHYPDMMGDIIEDVRDEVTGSDGIVRAADVAFAIRSGLSAERIGEVSDAITEAYTEALKYRTNLNTLDKSAIMESVTAWNKNISDYVDILMQLEDINKESSSLTELKANDEYGNFIKLQEKVIKLNQILNDTSSTVAERQTAYWELDETSKALDELAQKYPAVKDIISTNLSKLGIAYDDTTDTIVVAQEAWEKSLDDAQKGILTNVDKIISTMEKLYSGEAIDQKSAWEIINLDDGKLLSNIKIDENGDYIFDLEQIIALKDEIIQKEIEQRELSIETAKAEKAAAENQLETNQKLLDGINERRRQLSSRLATYVGNTQPTELLNQMKELDKEGSKLEENVKSNTAAVESYNTTIRNETLLIETLRKKTGDLTDTLAMLEAQIKRLQNEVSALETEAEARLKAQEHVIDGIIKSEESRLKALEKEKDALDEQLDALEKQKEELESIVSNYEKVADVVNDVIKAQIDEIEKERKTVEDSYNKRIELLKQENEERNDAIEYQKKLAALENAKNNKTRVYDQERGFIYASKIDDIINAENDLTEFENEQSIKALEKERDAALEVYDKQKSDLEEYAEQWQEAIESITKAENDLLAQQILGSDYREKINRKDTQILNKFKSDYANYNNQLKNIVGTEIDNLKKAVTAKDEEIQVKQDQIKVWQDYKSEIQDAASTIKNGLEDYINYLGTVVLNENSSYEERIRNMNNFVQTYSGLISQITGLNAQIDATQTKINSLGSSIGSINVSGTISSVGEAFTKTLGDILEQLVDLNKNLAGGGIASAGAKISGLFTGQRNAEGGVNDKTGYVWMDGTKSRPELTLNNTDAAKLYNMLHGFSFYNNFGSGMLKNVKASSGNSTVFNIQHLDVNGVQNPIEFAREFKKNINEYWNSKLTESKVY